MSADTTGSARPHRVSPYRTALEIVTQGRSDKQPTFGVTEEKGPGGIVVPLLRCDVPVCEEFPESDLAFNAMLRYHLAFAEHRRQISDGALAVATGFVA